MAKIREIPFEYALRNLGRSRTRLIASLFGSALVVLLVLSAAGFVRGMQLTLSQNSAIHENVILLGTGSEEAIERSEIPASAAGVASASIAGLKETAGVRYVSPEIHMALPLRLEEGDESQLQSVMRGVQREALLVHSEVEIVEGRFPSAGMNEIMVGALASTRLGVPERELAIGETLNFDSRDWTIVGRFSAPNTVMDAEVWIPLTDLQIATKRGASLSCAVISLDDATFADVDMFAKSRLDLELAAIREVDYYSSIDAFYRPIRIMILITATLISAGGLLGGLNTMYASFAARVREIGMLQALGFRRHAIMINLAEESMFMAACGAVIGIAIGLIFLNGVAVRFSMGAFAITIDAPVILIGLAGGAIVGFVGAIPPTIRCLRLPITQALKSS